MIRGCDCPVQSRGLCAKHCTAAIRLVSAGKLTWAELEVQGLAMPRVSKKPWVYEHNERRRSKPKPRCIIVGCDRNARVRGLCLKHHSVALSRIKRGVTCWETLVAKGKALPPKYPGRKHSSDERRRIGESQRGKLIPRASKQKMQKAHRGMKKPWVRQRMLGWNPSTETRQRMSESHRRENLPPGVLERRRTAMKAHWQEWNAKMAALYGPNYRAYPLEFDGRLRQAIRKRDGFCCQICGCPQRECFRKLDVHHVDANKANNNPANLVSLCQSCRSSKVKTRPAYWKRFFRKLLKAVEKPQSKTSP